MQGNKLDKKGKCGRTANTWGVFPSGLNCTVKTGVNDLPPAEQKG